MAHHTSIPVLNQRFGAQTVSAGQVLGQVFGQGPGQAHGQVSGGARATSLYIHVPFCFHKCHYCDFYSIVDKQDRQAPFAERLCQELAALGPYAGPIETVFVGGGTPTLMRADLWKRVLGEVKARFEFVPGFEFTVECNPETATPELLGVLVEGGVNRISIGAQSFNPGHLKTLERWHDPANVLRAIEMARGAGIARQSLDLIWGVPGQTLQEWEQDLRTALSAATTHMSCYSLTYEPGTAMTARLAKGEFTKTDEDLDADMFCLTLEVLRAAGLERYEVSNFARPGDECRHNLAYWRQRSWLAAGPSASGHVNGTRWKNLPRLDDYLSFNDRGFAPAMDVEVADAKRNLRERIMTGLRIVEGLDGVEVLRLAGTGAGKLDAVVQRSVEQGLLRVDGGRWVLTDAGFMVADSVAGEMMRMV